jgi:hypothetical protein
VHGVGVDRLREIRADRPLGGLLGVGRAHDVAILEDGVVAFEHLDHHRTRAHELHQVVEEGTALVHRVEAFGLGARQVMHLRRHHFEARLLEPAVDLPDHVLRDGVGLDDREGALHRHEKSPLNQ